MVHELPEFVHGPHRFRIEVAESCMIHTITLAVRADSARPTKPHWIDIYRVTEDDYVWNTLLADRPTDDGHRDLTPAIRFLEEYAPRFAAEHPDALAFSDGRKARRFSEKHLKTPIGFRGYPFPARYPGS